jgi:hypothetical protein
VGKRGKNTAKRTTNGALRFVISQFIFGNIFLWQIAEFKYLNNSMNVFILSTRAGVLGINLASADSGGA